MNVFQDTMANIIVIKNTYASNLIHMISFTLITKYCRAIAKTYYVPYLISCFMMPLYRDCIWRYLLKVIIFNMVNYKAPDNQFVHNKK